MESEMEEIQTARPVKNSHLKATFNIMQTAGWLQRRIMQALKPFELSEPQFNVLRILNAKETHVMNLYEVQEQMAQKASNVSRLIDKLLEKKLVARKTSKDNKRRVDISITQKGVTLLQSAEAALNGVFSNIFLNLKKDKIKTLNKLLESIRNED